LLGWRSGIANAALSWRPLVRLGIVSYSVYLIHEPVVETVEVFAPPALRLSLLVMPVAIAAGVALGVVFHLTIERPCMSSATWIRLGPTLTHLCRWVDPLYGCLGITKPARTGANREGSVASAAEKPVG
jgi:peptidoglycan/LPS O-acetylase OafA/YrhL